MSVAAKIRLIAILAALAITALTILGPGYVFQALMPLIDHWYNALAPATQATVTKVMRVVSLAVPGIVAAVAMAIAVRARARARARAKNKRKEAEPS